MDTYNRKVFAIINATRDKILTNVAWSGLSMQEIPKGTDLFTKLPLSDADYCFEQSSMDRDCIQYYKTFHSAVETIEKVQSRDNYPILDPLIIVTFNIAIATEETEMFSKDALKNIPVLVKFERDAAKQLNVEPDVIANYRKGDFSGYTLPKFQKAYEGWLAFNSITAE